jgi:hypothetical protein
MLMGRLFGNRDFTGLSASPIDAQEPPKFTNPNGACDATPECGGRAGATSGASVARHDGEMVSPSQRGRVTSYHPGTDHRPPEPSRMSRCGRPSGSPSQIAPDANRTASACQAGTYCPAQPGQWLMTAGHRIPESETRSKRV